MARLYEENQTPEWMKPLKTLHQRRKSEQSEKEDAERRKAEEERQRFEAMPAWKKQLVYKKRAKSAENLLTGSHVNDPNKSETKVLEAASSECNGNATKKPVKNGEVNVETIADDVGNDDNNADNKQHDQEAMAHKVDEVENEDEREENEHVGDDEKKLAELLSEKENEENELAEKIDADDNLESDESEVKDAENGNCDEDNNKHEDELTIESSENKSEGEDSPHNTRQCEDSLAIPDDNEEMIQCLDADEGGSEETGGQQVDVSSIPTEIDNKNEDKNEE